MTPCPSFLADNVISPRDSPSRLVSRFFPQSRPEPKLVRLPCLDVYIHAKEEFDRRRILYSPKYWKESDIKGKAVPEGRTEHFRGTRRVTKLKNRL